jgi:hypothetical protein
MSRLTNKKNSKAKKVNKTKSKSKSKPKTKKVKAEIKEELEIPKETEVIEIAAENNPEKEVQPVKADTEILELEKKKKTYWTEDTEAAVVEFLTHDFNYYNVQLEKYIEDCNKRNKPTDDKYIQSLLISSEKASHSDMIYHKDKVFRERIQKPLNKLVENIIFNFKLFRPGVDIKTLHNDCLSFVYGKFANFKPSKNTKSFSYFGTVAKHYLQGEIKELDKFIKTNLDYDDHRDEADGVDTFELHDKSDLDKSYTLFHHVILSIEKELDNGHLSENDMKVGDAIIQIFKNHEILGAYNKNHVYQLIKENTGLQTKDITYSLSRFRVFYRLLKQDFIKKDTDDE